MDERRGTKPVNRGRTTPFGDAFVGGQQAGAQDAGRGTRPLAAAPTANLAEALRARATEYQRELAYVRHLVNLFAPPISILRAGADLAALAAGSEEWLAAFGHSGMVCARCGQALLEREACSRCGACGATTHEACHEATCVAPDCGSESLEGFQVDQAGPCEILVGLGEREVAFARAIAEALKRDPRVRQRAQVSLHQYDEAVRAYQFAMEELAAVQRIAPNEAWDRMNELGIERIKGKAYAICGFYENFKRDAVLDQLFPAPNNPATAPAPTAPLAREPGGEPAPPAGAAPPQGIAPLLDGVAGSLAAQVPAQLSGLLGKLRGMFGNEKGQ